MSDQQIDRSIGQSHLCHSSDHRHANKPANSHHKVILIVLLTNSCHRQMLRMNRWRISSHDIATLQKNLILLILVDRLEKNHRNQVHVSQIQQHVERPVLFDLRNVAKAESCYDLLCR